MHEYESVFFEVFFFESLFRGSLIECVMLFRAVTELEFVDGIFAESAFCKIAEADGFSFDALVQLVGEIFLRPVVYDQHALPVVFYLFLLLGQFPFLYFDVIFPGEVAKRVIVAELLVFHDEMDGSPPFAAGKTFTDVFGGRYIERGRAVVMERAEPYVVDTSFTQGDKVRNDIDDVSCVQYPVYCQLVNHS